jgi:hypothetical protein
MFNKKILNNILWAVTAVFYLLSVFYLTSGFVLAQSSGGWKQAPDFKSPFNDWCSFLKFLNDMIKWVLVIGLLIGVVMIIYGGIKFVTAGGSTEAAGTAGKIIGFAAVGIVIIALAFALVRVLGSLTGVDFSTECEGQQILQ